MPICRKIVAIAVQIPIWPKKHAESLIRHNLQGLTSFPDPLVRGIS